MEKDFVPYEQAKELKKLGFDKTTYFAFYDNDGGIIISYQVIILTPAPLYQQAFRWFREKGMRFDITTSLYDIGLKYKVRIGSSDILMNDYETYEEAEIVCLNELINMYKIMLNNKKEGVESVQTETPPKKS